MKTENTVMRLYVHITLRYTVIRFPCFQDSFHLLLTAAVRRSSSLCQSIRAKCRESSVQTEIIICPTFLSHTLLQFQCSFSTLSAACLSSVHDESCKKKLLAHIPDLQLQIKKTPVLMAAFITTIRNYLQEVQVLCRHVEIARVNK